MSVDINGAIAEWLTNVLREIGDPDGLRKHAEELQQQADHVRSVHAQIAADVNSSPWSGSDYEAFSSAWQEHAKLAEDTANSLQATANQVDDHADRTWAIVKEIIGIALEILEILAIGLLLSWLLAGIANLIWARVAPLIERIVQLLERFRAMLGDFAEWAKEVGSTAGKVGEKIGTMIGRGTEKVITDVPEYARAYVNFYLAEAITPALSGRDVSWAENAWTTGVFFGFDYFNTFVREAAASIRLGSIFADAAEETSARAGTSAATDLSPERSLAVDGADVEGQGAVPPDPANLFRDVPGKAGGSGARSGSAPLQETDGAAARIHGVPGSADAGSALNAQAAGTDAEAWLSEAHLGPGADEQELSSWDGVGRRGRSATDLADGASVRKGAAPSVREAPGSGPNRARSTSRVGQPQEIPTFSDGDSVRSVHIVRPGDEAPLSYEGGPDITRPLGSAGTSKVSLPENSVVKAAPSEGSLGTSAHDAAAPESGAAARNSRPEHTSDEPTSERPQVETRHFAEAHPSPPAREAVPEVHPAEPIRPEGTPETPRPATPVAETPPAEAPPGARAHEAVPEAGPVRAARSEDTPETPVLDSKASPAAKDRPEIAAHDAAAPESGAAARNSRPEHIAEGPFPERLQVETPRAAEARPGTPAHEALLEASPAQPIRPEGTLKPSRPETPVVQSSSPASPSLPRTPDSPASVHGQQADTSLPNVDADALRMGDILSPRTSVRTNEFRVPEPSKLPETHKPFEPKTLADSVTAGAKEGFNIVIGNLQTNAVVNHIHNADQQVTAQQFGLQVLGGFLGGTRQSLFHTLPVGERFGYRGEQPGQASIMHWLFSATPVSWAYYSMYLTAKEAILNGASGQSTPTEITRQTNQ
ncbi:WXG100 family type VII secretion target [Streptomyces sp900105755]|uniref:WXG100 family type VII secretion target n=1 Tax=Streptomyces sp. 900105755 TaxID=3154389 RepID=UPI0033212641